MSLEAFFPALAATGYRVTSPATPIYNCFAWAASRDDAWWEPNPDGDGYWPPGVLCARTLEAVSAAYATLGYQPCPLSDVEAGFEKIAVYAKNGLPTHAARQMTTGVWSSKLGALEDVEHQLAGLEGEEYGTVALVLRRPTRPTA
jgi:hypothetical protein